ncbi:hypothetical protein ACFWPH_06090 [Nocardia sp. NPDC058499]|uniref:hypothetical protein n=1 Tax=Nocardia sp. NPDC058499 TaxID=3346530 RepID=UPI00364C11DA
MVTRLPEIRAAGIRERAVFHPSAAELRTYTAGLPLDVERQVEWATAQITYTHEWVDYAFCAPSCRKVFVEDHVRS